MIAIDYPHIEMGDDGIARVGKTRYKVLQLAGEHFYYGWTAEELLRQHPDLRPEEIYAALGYFYDHREQIVDQLKNSAAEVENLRGASGQLSRSELLARKAKTAGG